MLKFFITSNITVSYQSGHIQIFVNTYGSKKIDNRKKLASKQMYHDGLTDDALWFYSSSSVLCKCTQSNLSSSRYLRNEDYQLIDNQSLLLAFNRLLKFKIGLDQFFEGIRMRLIQIFYNLEKIIESQVFSKTIIDE